MAELPLATSGLCHLDALRAGGALVALRAGGALVARRGRRRQTPIRWRDGGAGRGASRPFGIQAPGPWAPEAIAFHRILRKLTPVLAGFVAWTVMDGAALAAGVTVSGAWARATLPHQDETAAYMTLQSAADDTLTEIDSPDAGMVMLHETSQTGGTAMMKDLEALPLPAGQKVALAPDGRHLMVMEMPHPLVAGSVLHLSLHFAHAGVEDVAVPVLPANAPGPAR